MQRIIPVDNHFEAYSEYGQYLCQGDTWDDCAEKVVNMIKQEVNRFSLLSF